MLDGTLSWSERAGPASHSTRCPPLFHVTLAMYKYLSVVILVISCIALTSSQDILQPPMVIKPDRQNTLYFKDGRTALVDCDARGSPKPSYAWQRDGNIIDNDDSFYDVNRNTGTLTIPNFTKSNEGDYTCLATNNVGGDIAVSLSKPQTLLLYALDPFKPSTISGTTTGTAYSYGKLVCADKGTIAGPSGSVNFQWYINEDALQVQMDDDRIFIASDGSLHFTYLKPNDQLPNSSSYHCGVAIIIAGLIQIGNPQKLIVASVNAPTSTTPVLQFSNEGIKAKLGSDAQLQCVFSGYDSTQPDKLPVIHWYDDAGKEIGTSSKYEFESKKKVLVIKGVTESDDRNYACQASTLSGSSVRKALHLDVISAPVWVKAPGPVVAIQGRQVTIHCHARSLAREEPASRPRWLINGDPFSGIGRPRTKLSGNGKALIVTDASKAEDIMCIQCVVENNYGTTMGDACIEVILPIRVKVDCNKCPDGESKSCTCRTWDIKRGNKIIVQFTSTTDPGYKNRLRELWIVHNKTYRLPTLPPYMTHDKTSGQYILTTENLDREDYEKALGDYQYRVFHSFDSFTVDISIRQEGTVGPAVSQAGLDMWIIGLIIGLAFLLAIVVIIFLFCIYRKQQEGDYDVDKKETNAGLNPAQEVKNKAFPDLSRPEYDMDEEDQKKPDPDLHYDEGPLDDESLGEYGMEDISHFNENGSFIGKYNAHPVPVENLPHNQSTETTI